MKSAAAFPVATALALTVLACGGEQTATGSWGGTIRDSAGITIIENPAEGVWTDETRWRLEEVLRIGSAEGDPNYQFGQIGGIALSDDGKIFAMDQQAGMIRGFTGDGEFLYTIGKPGNGPGEISNQGFGPQGATVLAGPGDTLFVPDVNNQRVSLFLNDGTHLGSYRVDIAAGFPVRWEGQDNGTVVTQLRPLNLPGQGTTDSMDIIVSRGADGSLGDTLLHVPAGKTFSFSGGAPEFNFFSPEPVWTLAPEGGAFYGVNNQYRIGRYGPGGALEQIVSKPFEVEPVSQAAQDAFMVALNRAWTEAGVPPQALEQLQSVVHFADNFPAYLQFMTGPSNTFWVQHIQVLEELSAEERENFNPLLNLGAAQWDVFDADGQFLGVMEMPMRFQPLRFIEDRIYGIWRDDLDVQHVMVLLIHTST